MTKAKGDGGKGLYVRSRFGQRDMENEDRVFGSGADGYDNADVMMAMSVEELLDWIMDSRSSYYITYRRDYLVDFKEYDGGNILLSDSRECRVRGIGNDQEDIKGSTQQCTKSRVAKHLGVAGLQQQNGLVEETNVTLLAKVRYFLIQSGLSKVFWAEDTTMSTYLVNKSPSSAIRFKTLIDMLGFLVGLLVLSKGCLNWLRNMSFNESGEYKKAFIGSGIVACEVISKWKARLKDDMDAQSDVYVLSNGCRKCSGDNNGYYWEYTLGDCDVEKNGKWSCIYAAGSQEYQMVCTRLDITSADVGMLDKKLRSYDVVHDGFVNNRNGVHDTYGGYKGGYLAKGARNRVKIRAKDSSGYCYRCLVKGYP
ncbi:zinc finger, CCHC-type containing protein [Tanacetum coccineum]